LDRRRRARGSNRYVPLAYDSSASPRPAPGVPIDEVVDNPKTDCTPPNGARSPQEEAAARRPRPAMAPSEQTQWRLDRRRSPSQKPPSQVTKAPETLSQFLNGPRRWRGPALRISPGGLICYFCGKLAKLPLIPFRLLSVLAQRAASGRGWTPSKEVFEAVWPGQKLCDLNLIHQAMTRLRSRLCKLAGLGSAMGLLLIEAGHGLGFRLGLPVSEVQVENLAA
jgi:hypothetical protein